MKTNSRREICTSYTLTMKFHEVIQGLKASQNTAKSSLTCLTTTAPQRKPAIYTSPAHISTSALPKTEEDLLASGPSQGACGWVKQRKLKMARHGLRCDDLETDVVGCGLPRSDQLEVADSSVDPPKQNLETRPAK